MVNFSQEQKRKYSLKTAFYIRALAENDEVFQNAF